MVKNLPVNAKDTGSIPGPRWLLKLWPPCLSSRQEAKERRESKKGASKLTVPLLRILSEFHVWLCWGL